MNSSFPLVIEEPATFTVVFSSNTENVTCGNPTWIVNDKKQADRGPWLTFRRLKSRNYTICIEFEGETTSICGYVHVSDRPLFVLSGDPDLDKPDDHSATRNITKYLDESLNLTVVPSLKDEPYVGIHKRNHLELPHLRYELILAQYTVIKLLQIRVYRIQKHSLSIHHNNSVGNYNNSIGYQAVDEFIRSAKDNGGRYAKKHNGSGSTGNYSEYQSPEKAGKMRLSDVGNETATLLYYGDRPQAKTKDGKSTTAVKNIVDNLIAVENIDLAAFVSNSWPKMSLTPYNSGPLVGAFAFAGYSLLSFMQGGRTIVDRSAASRLYLCCLLSEERVLPAFRWYRINLNK
ncbi:unnamed protein product [Haemonchus placei]|uniref:PITH domain-containing protein n=1 Tax=Haemonchus placei TaxID=6290 RepID=A0A158QMT3_HAEPC|nr:unnamed protein product [Haemonchus placei]